MKVMVIGNAGTGKSTLARQLAARTGWSLLALDHLWHAMDYSHVAEMKFAQKQRFFMATGSNWIIDGNYTQTMAALLAEADVIIWCQTPRPLAIMRVIWWSLRFRYDAQSRPEMPAGFQEKFDRDYWLFLKFIWDYPQRTQQSVVPMLQELRANQQLIVVHHQGEKQRVLRELFAIMISCYFIVD